MSDQPKTNHSNDFSRANENPETSCSCRSYNRNGKNKEGRCKGDMVSVEIQVAGETN